MFFSIKQSSSSATDNTSWETIEFGIPAPTPGMPINDFLDALNIASTLPQYAINFLATISPTIGNMVKAI